MDEWIGIQKVGVISCILKFGGLLGVTYGFSVPPQPTPAHDLVFCYLILALS